MKIICIFLTMKTGRRSLITQYPTQLKQFHSVVLFLLFISLRQFSSAQSTPISGVVNTYYRVADIDPTKACVIVANSTGLNYNDKVMLIQMKGATINTSNSSSFGDTLSLNHAGNYEIGTVCDVIGDSVFLVYMLLNQYTLTGKVQLVKIPQYYSATVTDTLKPAPWNNATGTGGVLAISVEEDLVLNAPVYADSSGFRGGAYRLSSGTCGNSFFPPPANAFYYDANVLSPQDGAFKGEGVADVIASQSGGKGAPANGGGGGNNHNNGGAGGANLAPGGNGGGNGSTTGCTVSNPSRAGKALSSYGGKKIFFGGGGGAGHSNYNFPNPTGGGNGGGIVFIEAGNLVGNNRKISANGNRGGPSLGDGASGSGAGGTMILDIANYIGAVTLEANGAQGGASNDGGNVQRCYGGGGGGSGGVIYFSGSAPAVTTAVNGGALGPETGFISCTPVPSFAGTAGQIISNYNYISSTVLENGYCALLLPVELLAFKAIYKNGQTLLRWQIGQTETAKGFIVERAADGRNWTAIGEQAVLNGISEYQFTDPAPQPNTSFYRLKMIDINNAVNYSSIQKIFVPVTSDLIKIYPNPAHKQIIITGNLSAASEIYLHDLSGKLIWKKRMDVRQNITEILLPDLPTGIYIVKIGGTIKKLSIQ